MWSTDRSSLWYFCKFVDLIFYNYPSIRQVFGIFEVSPASVGTSRVLLSYSDRCGVCLDNIRHIHEWDTERLVGNLVLVPQPVILWRVILSVVEGMLVSTQDDYTAAVNCTTCFFYLINSKRFAGGGFCAPRSLVWSARWRSMVRGTVLCTVFGFMGKLDSRNNSLQVYWAWIQYGNNATRWERRWVGLGLVYLFDILGSNPVHHNPSQGTIHLRQPSE